MEQLAQKPPHWYSHVWGKILIVVGIALLLFLGLVIITTARYWLQLKDGEQPSFIQEHYSRFTAAKVTGVAQGGVDRTILESADDPYLGFPGAQVVVVVFADYKCPNCRVALPILQKVMEKYGYNVKMIVRDFPAESIHPGATTLAEVANCAREQDRFWQMHDLLYQEQDMIGASLESSQLEQLTLIAGVDIAALQACMVRPDIEKEINQDYLDGARFGVAGTPTFFVNGDRVEGVVPYEAWENYLKAVLKK